jgi:hypothetical protein
LLFKALLFQRVGLLHQRRSARVAQRCHTLIDRGVGGTVFGGKYWI